MRGDLITCCSAPPGTWKPQLAWEGASGCTAECSSPVSASGETGRGESGNYKVGGGTTRHGLWIPVICERASCKVLLAADLTDGARSAPASFLAALFLEVQIVRSFRSTCSLQRQCFHPSLPAVRSNYPSAYRPRPPWPPKLRPAPPCALVGRRALLVRSSLAATPTHPPTCSQARQFRQPTNQLTESSSPTNRLISNLCVVPHI